jgi:phosphotransferase system enzyme I (PtsI)
MEDRFKGAEGRLEISGVPLAPGIAIGKAYRFKQIDLESLKSNAFPIEDINSEIVRLEKSIEKSRDQVSGLQRSALENGRKSVSDIFAAHIQLLQDESFIEGIRETVRKERLNVEYILSVKISEVETSFSSIENETVRTRLYDVQDVYHRLLRNLLDIEHVRVTPLVRARKNPILFAEHLLPSDIALLEFRKVSGIIIEEASAVSHVAIITKAMRIPAVINIPGISSLIRSDCSIIIDGFSGKVIINPTKQEIVAYRRKKKAYARKETTFQEPRRCLTRDGVRIRLEANANIPDEVCAAIRAGAEGIGLLRTEFYYLGRTEMPQVEEELDFYKRIHESSDGRPLTIRLLDLGADKSLPYLKQSPEENPQLGIRGIRYLFAHPELMRNHLRSLLLSTRFGPVNIMVPFVSIAQEIDYILEVIEDIRAREDLDSSGYRFGIMVEIPSIIWALPNIIEKVDFLSIGTNDLTQFTFAVSREDERLEEYRKASLPVLLKMVKQIVKIANTQGKDVSVCGEAASDPITALLLIGVGIRHLSTRISALDIVRHEIENKSIDQANEAALEYLEAIDADYEGYRKAV